MSAEQLRIYDVSTDQLVPATQERLEALQRSVGLLVRQRNAARVLLDWNVALSADKVEQVAKLVESLR